ncbi:SGNH/GDSL hydrolase family protein [Devosia aurantiaca]|uniref:DUF459 domain-containing protein n=1 Tax=Devosia aurantiaca TaxID=2714858 RepID=A0A6M1SUZ6_9HYPH|nr:DUF459 domain-containing protein [Devosia aurantiaca]NGP16761.1 DUF459 domain-containing protein [Devosia aurantiaca]
MKRFVLLFLIAMLAVLDTAPAFAQAPGDDTLVVAQAQTGRRRTLFDLLFGEEPAPPAAPVPEPRRAAPRASAPAAAPVAAAPPPPPEPDVTKDPDATRLAVFGDLLAIDLTKALERFYAEDPNIVVVGQGVSSSGFVRNDYFDWNQTIEEQIAADSFDLAVVIIGINDRQDISANGQNYETLTEGWKAAYQARLNDFLNRLRAARKPVVWVGLPPMSKSDYSAAISQISALQKLAAFSGGAEFLDIYDRFLGEDGKYSSQGPDVNGQNARMRKDDGIHFSNAGSDKLAFYISQALSAFYRGGTISVAVADPLSGTDAAAMLRPPYQGLGQTRLLEVAGAVTPISRAPQRASDLLMATGSSEAAPAFSLDQLMQAPTGRVDAFGVGIDPEGDLPDEPEVLQ